jgi:hypothetical protein
MRVISTTPPTAKQTMMIVILLLLSGWKKRLSLTDHLTDCDRDRTHHRSPITIAIDDNLSPISRLVD